MKTTKLPVWTVGVLTLATGVFLLVNTSRAATPTPEYKVLNTSGKFQVRDYRAMAVAKAPMSKEGRNESFRKLFRYITGKNAKSQTISMTAPVLVEGEAGSISGTEEMSFILPENYEAPKPSDATIEIDTIPARRLAVLQFSGYRSGAREVKALKQLESWIKMEKLTTRGAPMFAYYDPRWTPGFLRRNEVMIPVAKR